MDASKIEELRAFVNVCNSNPSIFDDPSLAFFKDFVHSFGGRVPRKPEMAAGMSHGSDGGAEDSDADDEFVESDIELDSPEVEPDYDLSQKMGDVSIETSEEQQEAAQVSKTKAMEAVSEGKLEEATDHLTDAILRNPHSAILYANRASIFVKLKKPNAAVRDANAALQINPDSAKGYKARGMAKALLGQWEDAAKDLHLASKLDFDKEINAVLKKVEPNARKIEDHKRKYERLRKEKEQKKANRDRQHTAAKTQSSKSQQSEATTSLQEGSKFPSLFIKLGERDNMQARKTKIKIKASKSMTGAQMADAQISHGPTFDHCSGHEGSLASKQVLSADLPRVIPSCSHEHVSVDEPTEESGAPLITASPKTLLNVSLTNMLGPNETFEEIVDYEDSDKEGNVCEVKALSHADDLISSSHQGTLAPLAASDPPNALLHSLRVPTLTMMEKSLSMLQASTLLDFPQIRIGLQTLLSWASSTGLCFPKMESLLTELSDLHNSTLSTEILRLTSAKDELEKTLHQESLNMKSLLKNHDEKEEHLRLLDQEIKDLQTKRTTIQDELALLEFAITASKERMNHQQESLCRVSSELHTSTIFATQAEAQYKEKITSFTLDEYY